MNGEVETRWYVNTDGSTVQTSQAFYRLSIFAYTKADDGMELPRFESFFSFTPEGMPDDAEILSMVAQMIQDLKALRTAPIVDPYTGPAILSGKASGVFFHEVFGHRVEGHRQKHADEGQTFKKEVGEQLLPKTFSIYFDPTLERIAGTDLMGAYRYDNQGMKARRVDVIEQGGDRLDLIMIPKVGTAADVYALDMLVTQVEDSIGRKERIGFELIIESAMGMANIDTIFH